jgi:signal transduction histidine kinase
MNRAQSEGMQWPHAAAPEGDLAKLYQTIRVLAPLARSDSPRQVGARNVDHVLSVTGADAALIRIFEPATETFQFIAQRGFPDAYIRAGSAVMPRNSSRQVFASGEPILSADIANDPRIAGKTQVEYGFSSCAFLPLRGRDVVRGIIQLSSRDLGFFTVSKLEFLVALADFVGTVLENSELIESTQGTAAALKKSNAELQSLYQALTSLAPLARGDSTQQVADRMIEEIVAATGADAGIVRIYDWDKQIFAFNAQRGFPPGYFAETVSSRLGLASQKVFDEGLPLISGDTAGDPRIRGHKQRQMGFKSCAFLPLKGKDRVRGIIHLVSRQPGFFTEEKRDYLLALANFVGIALENSELLHASVAYATELEKSNAELDRFAYVASHDLQEPLRMIAGYTQLLARKYAPQLDATAHEYIGFAVEGAKRMQTLLSDLLIYSRVTTRGREFAPVDCTAAVAGSVKQLAAQIDQSGASVAYSNLPTIHADGAQLALLFGHLIENALKYRSERSPHIEIAAERHGRYWVVSVRDNGIGIEAKYFERIFVVFQRLHTRDRYVGNGIGLAICKKIVERHGGKIWVESQPGRGSTFQFTLPAQN